MSTGIESKMSQEHLTLSLTTNFDRRGIRVNRYKIKINVIAMPVRTGIDSGRSGNSAGMILYDIVVSAQCGGRVHGRRAVPGLFVVVVGWDVRCQAFLSDG